MITLKIASYTSSLLHDLKLQCLFFLLESEIVPSSRGKPCAALDGMRRERGEDKKEKEKGDIENCIFSLLLTCNESEMIFESPSFV